MNNNRKCVNHKIITYKNSNGSYLYLGLILSKLSDRTVDSYLFEIFSADDLETIRLLLIANS